MSYHHPALPVQGDVALSAARLGLLAACVQGDMRNVAVVAGELSCAGGKVRPLFPRASAHTWPQVAAALLQHLYLVFPQAFEVCQSSADRALSSLCDGQALRVQSVLEMPEGQLCPSRLSRPIHTLLLRLPHNDANGRLSLA